ncbi:MAG: ATP-binding cassette domain-containing protein, partial [Anaeroplasmataceae bacterium]|nr:ATP-binding cassette domain-containing protein [Anaeroplasmataceae bacterium]
KIYKVKKKEIVAIQDINLIVNRKDIYGIIGLSGAGKSTLIRCINYLEKPTIGNVYYKGTSLSELKNKELRKIRQKIGMIFQNFNLLEQRTVLSNVLFPLEVAHVKKEHAIRRAKELLEIVGLSDKLNAYPSQLSGGQKQRVAIARALANNPDILLCDEATSALDPNTTESILNLLKEINEVYGITIILITHEMKVVEQICHKVAIIDESVIKETGNVADIFTNPKTPIAKSLIFPYLNKVKSSFGNVVLKLHFDGNVLEPVIANLILKTKVLVNIVEANIKSKEDQIFGEMILQLPNHSLDIVKVKQYLIQENISFLEDELNCKEVRK